VINDKSHYDHRVRLRVAVIVRVGSRVLMVYDPNYRGAWWILPGGAVEFGESIPDAGAREVGEETGIAVTVTGFWRFREIVEPDPDGDGGEMRRSFEVFVAARPASDEVPPLIDPTGPDATNVADCRWVPIADLAPQGHLESLLPLELIDEIRNDTLTFQTWESVSLPDLRITSTR